MKSISLFIIIGLAFSGRINAQQSNEPDSLYQEIIHKYTSEFEKADQENRATLDSIGALRALELEQLYNKYPQNNAARKGLLLAFKSWLNVDSVATMANYVNSVSFNDNLWHQLMELYSYGLQNTRTDPFKYFESLEAILKNEDVINFNSLSFLYSELGKFEMMIQQDTKKAIMYFEKVVDLEVDSVEVEMAKRNLYDLRKLNIGQTVPHFKTQDINGNVIDIRNYKGKYVLIEFWATWCGPCLPEIPFLKKAYSKYGERNDFEMIGVSLDTDRDKLREFLKDHDIDWIQILDEGGENKWNGKLGTLFAVGNGIPKTFLIDKEGKIIATELRKERLSEILSEYLD